MTPKLSSTQLKEIKMRFVDLTGKRYGRLVVLNKAAPHVQPNKLKRTMWLCKCDCGSQYIAYGANLQSNHTQSCGCLQKERARESATTHGKSHTRLHRTWRHMVERCTNPNVRNYSDYGGRGITVCEEWRKFDNFYQWAMQNGYYEDLTIDRINNNGNYEPNNCRFTDLTVQANNKRTNHLMTANGETKTLTQWANELGISYITLLYRVRRGWSDEKAINTPARQIKR